MAATDSEPTLDRIAAAIREHAPAHLAPFLDEVGRQVAYALRLALSSVGDAEIGGSPVGRAAHLGYVSSPLYPVGLAFCPGRTWHPRWRSLARRAAFGILAEVEW